ncbi:hypothetical protein [Deinococcus enclensis]|uniref:Uncharacterized protein n=1 Tax=Deinococcus enclensis TaxID=1049582 RepID=A0ABT9MEV8_9DEIO|nr:hypothetical protein [Deinococcus enclensis]MDP9765109.1 hypothetical protein [Deinococcus enclensis]
MTPLLSLQQAAQELNLPYGYVEQDWGITNADATRLGVFVAYYVRHRRVFPDWNVEFSLGELLLESANDVLRDGTGPLHDVEAAVQAILSQQGEAPTQALLDYWVNLDRIDDGDQDASAWYPVAALLRTRKAHLSAPAECGGTGL